MFDLKTEELGRKGCIFWSFMVYCVCQIMGCEGRVTKRLRNVAYIEVNVIFKRILVGKWEGNSLFRRPMSIWG